MLDEINAVVMGEECKIARKTLCSELAKKYQDKFKFQIIAAKEKHSIKSLSEEIHENDEIEFIDLTDVEGNRIYYNGLIYLLVYSAYKLFGSKTKIEVKHSVDKGLYIEINKDLTEEKLQQLYMKMKEIVELDLPITKTNVSRIDAIDYFIKTGDIAKAGLLQYNSNTYITLYKLDTMYNYFFSIMPISTGILNSFELHYISNKGFVLLYPVVELKGKIKPYVHHKALFDVFSTHSEWAKIMKVSNVPQLNEIVSRGTIGDFIRIEETLQSARLLNIAKEIYSKKNKIKIIMIGGPSSSGKTTTCKKLSMYLKSFGLEPKTLSLDDYYMSVDKVPKNDDGSPDYEDIDALDLKLLKENILDLLAFKEVTIPTYNFLLSQSEFKNKLKLNNNDVLLIEGIHALNPKLNFSIERENIYKIYLAALTTITLDDHNRISTADNRLLRRIIRDNVNRGNSVDITIKKWQSVRIGEEKYVFPYQDEADCVYNTAFMYELGVMKTYVEPLLYSVNPKSEHFYIAKKLIDLLKGFLPIPSDSIPQDSIIREFIGGSCFK